MPKILISFFLAIFFISIFLITTPSIVEAKLCSQTNWQVDVSSTGQPHNIVLKGKPYTVTITIPSSEYSSSFTQFKARTMSRIPLQPPGSVDDTPIQVLNGVNEETVTAPAKNASGPTVVKIDFNKSGEFFNSEGDSLIEIDYYPKSSADNSWARKCDTNSSSERFKIQLPELPKCSIDGIDSCMVEGNGFNAQANASQSGFDYFYFLVNGNPPKVGSDMGVELLYTGGGSTILPGLTGGKSPYKAFSYTAEDTLFSGNVVGATKQLSSYQSVFDALPLDPAKKYSLFVVGAVGNPANPFDTGTSGIPGKVCAAVSFVKAADTSAPICKEDLGGSSGGTGGAPFSCVEGENCTTAAGKTCVYDGNPGIDTAIGCVPTNPIEFGRTLIKFSIGIGGGIALLMMIIASFQMITSAGNADRLKAGQERFKNAVIGLLFIIFSVLLMRLIGIDILGLGKFLGA